MDASNDYTIKMSDHQDLSKTGFDRSTQKIWIEYDASEDLFELKINSTNEITAEELSTIISLGTEGQRIRAEYFKKLRNGA